MKWDGKANTNWSLEDEKSFLRWYYAKGIRQEKDIKTMAADYIRGVRKRYWGLNGRPMTEVGRNELISAALDLMREAGPWEVRSEHTKK